MEFLNKNQQRNLYREMKIRKSNKWEFAVFVSVVSLTMTILGMKWFEGLQNTWHSRQMTTYENFIDSNEVSALVEAKKTVTIKEETFDPRKEEIPFYMYPVTDFHWLYMSCNHTTPFKIQHDHADFAWRAMFRHPWRTNNQSHARLAILPASFDLFNRGACGTTNPYLAVEEVKSVVHRNPDLFPRVRHLVIMNDWLSRSRLRPIWKEIQRVLHPTSIIAKMENYDYRAPDEVDCTFALGYTSNYASLYAGQRNPQSGVVPTPLVFGKERKYSVHLVGAIGHKRNRIGMRHRNRLFQSEGYIPNPFIVTGYENLPDYFQEWVKTENIRMCNTTNSSWMTDPNAPMGDYDRCLVQKLDRVTTQRTQELSNYTLVLRGDTLGSDRWINAMAAGTALIYVIEKNNDLDWLPFQHVIPWRDFVITIPYKHWNGDPVKALTKVLRSTSEERLLELQQLSVKYAADLDWTAYGSRTLENMLWSAANAPCSKMPNDTIKSS